MCRWKLVFASFLLNGCDFLVSAFLNTGKRPPNPQESVNLSSLAKAQEINLANFGLSGCGALNVMARPENHRTPA